MTASSPWLPDALWSGAFFDGQWSAAAQRQPVIEPDLARGIGRVVDLAGHEHGAASLLRQGACGATRRVGLGPAVDSATATGEPGDETGDQRAPG